MGRILRVVSLLVLTLLAVLTVSWFAFRDELLGKVLVKMEERLSKSGLHLEFGAHRLTWNGAAMLEGVELYSDEDKEERVATIENLRVRVPLMDFIRGESRIVISTGGSELGLETKAGELRLEDLEFKFDIDADSFLVDHFESRFQGLRVTVDGELARRRGEEEEMEKIVIPDLSWLINVATWLEFPEGSPTLAVHLKPQDGSKDGLDYEISFSGEKFRWKTLSLDRARLQLLLDEGAVELSKLSMEGFGGDLTGDVTIDYEKGQVVLSGVKSTMDPFRLIESLPLGESVRSSMNRFRSLGDMSVSGDRVVFDLRKFSRSQGDFKVVTGDGVGLTVASKEIVLEDLSAGVAFSKGDLVINADRFSAFGGSGSAYFSRPTSGVFHYRAGIDGSGFSAARIAKTFGDDDEHLGTVKVSFKGSGGAKPRSHSGTGRVEISGGKYYSIPIFGGLRSFLKSKSKMFKDDIGGKFEMDFQLKNGVTHSDNLKIEDDGTKISVAGKVDHVDKTADLYLQIGLKGIVGTVTSVVGKIFTIHGEGPIGSVQWSLAPFSVFNGTPLKDLGDGAAAVVEKTGDVVGGIGEAVGDGVKKTVDKTGDFVGGVGDGIKKGAQGAFDGIFGKKKGKKEEAEEK